MKSSATSERVVGSFVALVLLAATIASLPSRAVRRGGPSDLAAPDAILETDLTPRPVDNYVEVKQQCSAFYPVGPVGAAKLAAKRPLRNNEPCRVHDLQQTELYLLAEPEAVPSNSGGKRMRLQLVNGGEGMQAFDTCEGMLQLTQQARDADGNWHDIEHYEGSGCGLAYYTVQLPPRFGWNFTARRYKGSLPTTLRFALRHGGETVYYNEFEGSIDRAQLISRAVPRVNLP